VQTNRRTILSLIILTLLVATFGRIVYVRGLGLRMGAAPASLHTRYASEEAWVVDEIVRDITEMSAYPAKATIPSISAEAGGRYRVILGAQSVDLDLHDDLWTPALFTPLARAASEMAPTPPRADADDASPVSAVLLELTPQMLVTTSQTISRALKTNMRNAASHEAAALTLGAFALRESTGRFHDTRWAMNRMTAHLAMAAAANPRAPGSDGRLANALLLTLANRQVRALEAVDAFTTTERTTAVDAWIRAIRVRITDDTRQIETPASATLLEKLEYFRARRLTTTGTAQVAMAAIGGDSTASWLRLVEASPRGVEDGWLITEGLKRERAEYEAVFQRVHGRSIDRDPATALNARATRCLQSGTPDILPWGAWAEFEQRQLALFVDRADRFYRHQLGSQHEADSQKAAINGELDRLAMFPLATIFRTAGVKGGEADLSYINQAISSVIEAPERVTPAAWAFLEFGTHYEPVRRGIPPASTWFIAPSARVPYDAASRLKDAGHRVPMSVVESVRQQAPYDYGTAGHYLSAKYGQTAAPSADVLAAYGPRLEYDIRALRAACGYAGDDSTRRLELLKTSCEISSADCMSLGWELARSGRAEDAARAYERAFADPALDVVGMANFSGWLVSYYYDHGRTAAALDLANRSASTGAFAGLVTGAYLYERLGRLNDAEEMYRAVADRYDAPAELLGFYYRAVVVHKEKRFENAWNTTLEHVFPHGLLPAAAGDARPAHGVIVTKDNKEVRAKGLQAGDIIVGLEGWQVDNLQQYRAINSFFKDDAMKLRAWRGKSFDVTITAPDRYMGIEFRSYPIEGWAEE
jgi:hypothetical protein